MPLRLKRGYDMKICPKCQAECDDDVKFCPKCGESLPEVEAEAPKAEERPAFCPQCGKPLDPDATFCAGCGAKIGTKAKAAAPAIFVDFASTGKDFFTKGPAVAAQKAAQSKGLAWIIYACLAVVAFMFAAATNIHQFFFFGLKRAYDVSGKPLRDAVKTMYRFGLGILFSFILASIVFAAFAFAIYLASKLVLKKNVSLMSVFNLVAVASIPVTIASLLNLLIGLTWAPLTVILYGTAIILSLYMMFTGIDKLADFEGKGANVFFFAIGIAAITISFFLMLFLGISAQNAFFRTGN